jgi:hypothetical protein
MGAVGCSHVKMRAAAYGGDPPKGIADYASALKPSFTPQGTTSPAKLKLSDFPQVARAGRIKRGCLATVEGEREARNS